MKLSSVKKKIKKSKMVAGRMPCFCIFV